MKGTYGLLQSLFSKTDLVELYFKTISKIIFLLWYVKKEK